MARYNTIRGTSKNDWLTGDRFGSDLIYGGSGNDYLFGYGGKDRLFGEAGDDRLYGGDHDDTLDGGAGADHFYGGSGTDTVTYENSWTAVRVNLALNTALDGDAQGDSFYSIENLIGSDFRDRLTGNDVANVIEGRGGYDVIQGYGGNDTLYGGSGIDTISGGSGNDTLDGGDGHDDLSGGFGDDLFIGGEGSDNHFGGIGTDTISYEASGAGVYVDLLSGVGIFGDAQGDTYDSIDNVSGSVYSDSIIGDDNKNVIVGGGGQDRLFDRGGDDTIYGGDGSDFLFGGAGADDYYGGSGTDTVSFLGSNSEVTVDLGAGTGSGSHAEGDSYDGIENVFGTVYADTLIGNDGSNVLIGYYGGDVLIGGGGDDVLQTNYNGASDTFVFEDSRGLEADLVLGFEAGIDKIDLTATEFTGFNDLDTVGDRYWEQVGDDTVIHYYDHTITLRNVDLNQLSPDDLLFS